MTSNTGRYWSSRRSPLWIGLAGAGLLGGSLSLGTVPTTLRDFYVPGTQPITINDPMASVGECRGCHGNFNPNTEPYRPWAASMMGQAARDPLYHAALAIANQDAAFAGDLCIRCHAPSGWIQGRSTPTNGSSLTGSDFEGVSCNTCHRLVDPIYQNGNPSADPEILAALTEIPPSAHSGSYVIDNYDRRRGPYLLDPGFPAHDWFQSPFHKSSRLCATCHDVSNPAFERQANGTYALGALDQPNPSSNKYDQFPVERTYSEWEKSLFAQGPVNVGGRFGGNLTAVSSCQDCHMPPTTGLGCFFGEVRSDLPTHQFNGGNTWVLNAVRNLYPDSETGLDTDSVSASIGRAVYMLQNASDMELSVSGNSLKVRIINQSGHKLPTGYPEGRRMWVNVQFLNGSGGLVAERGAYNAATASLNTADTKVYEAKIGVDAAVSAATGVPVGPSFHFAINNVWYQDNRIPPRGFTNAGFASVQAAPVAYAYADGQHWDDTLFAIPAGAASATVTVYYQTASKEYVEFLRDANTTNSAGQTLYDQWSLTGKSTPVVMDQGSIALCYANCDNSSAQPVLNVNDFMCFLNRYAGGDPWANCDNSTVQPVLNVNDFMCFLNKYAQGCP